MGLFDAIKKAVRGNTNLTYEQVLSRASTIPESEKQYYQKDDYYSKVVFENSMFEKEVVPFEQRIKDSIPSATGLYVPEILMLHFCRSFPNPKNGGYPGYWWFKYGVRNVGAMLDSLAERGYITIDSKTQKYKLTEKGEKEQEDNAYVYYMHSKSVDARYTPWEMNKMLGCGDKGRYLKILDEIQANIEKKATQQKTTSEAVRQEFRKKSPEFRKLDDDNLSMENYIRLINDRDAQYKEDKDIDSYILFWEDIWKNDKSLLGAHWAFLLPDLYIKAKRYDDALACMPRLKKSGYETKVEKYIEKINEKRAALKGAKK